MATAKARALLIVLDGFGIGKDSPFNAIKNAKMPFYKELWDKYPHSQLLTHGAAVGLPDGVMGNSEVGHMTMGAGRIIYQDLTRISNAVADRSFFQNVELRKAVQAGARGRVHLMGLLSDGGVHSHIEHLFALLELCAELRVPEVALHCFLDGRDTPPDSSLGYVKRLLAHPVVADGARDGAATRVRIATVMGRYFAMDRDKRWDRVERAFRAMTGQIAPTEQGLVQAISASHAAGQGNTKSDEFVEPLLLDSKGAMLDGDSVIFFNYRSDRAREITTALTDPGFKEFDRGGLKLARFLGMTSYDPASTLPAAFGPQNMDGLFGEWLEKRSLQQFRIAETEKYAHVTFFFNGGREKPFVGEDRCLIPSPRDVPTYDLKPEMSAYEVAREAKARLERAQYDFALMNFANADMVGHTGNYEATVRAMEALDACLGMVVGAAERSGYHTLITADHGNAEEMCDAQGRPHTQHTLNPVPAIWVAPGSAVAPRVDRRALRDGGLADLMPTLCALMGLEVPREVTGKSLL